MRWCTRRLYGKRSATVGGVLRVEAGGCLMRGDLETRSRAPIAAARAAVLALGLLHPISGAAETQSSVGDSGGENASPFGGFVASGDVSLYTGAMGLSVPIAIPPGRKQATPSLRLVYSSSQSDGPFGPGWALPLGSIQRSTKKGVPHCLRNKDDFVIDLAGSQGELVTDPSDSSGNRYLMKIDERYLEATKNEPANTWEVIDRSGRTFRFGQGSAPGASRAFRGGGGATEDPNNDKFFCHQAFVCSCQFTSFWALTEIEDPNGNTIVISYEKLGGTPFVSAIEYGGDSHPSQTSNHPFRVEFKRGLRTNAAISYRLGVQQRLEWVINRIEVRSRPNPQTPFAVDPTPGDVRTYTLDYTTCSSGIRTRLCSVAGTDLPTQSFEYSTDQFAHDQVSAIYAPPAGGGSIRNTTTTNGFDVDRTVMDANGDGFLDLVDADNVTGDNWAVHYGSPTGFGGQGTWTAPGGQVESGKISLVNQGSGHYRVTKDAIDITGDGILDYVDARNDASPGSWEVYAGACTANRTCGFSSSSVPWNAGVAYSRLDENLDGDTPLEGSQRLIDMNADSFPDFVTLSSGSGGFVLRYGTGSAFEAGGNTFTNTVSQRITDAITSSQFTDTTKDLFDFNGDGLPDVVVRVVDAQVQNPAHCSSGGDIAVFLNDGFNFVSPPLCITTKPGLTAIRRSKSGDQWIDFFDINADGLPDRVYYDDATPTNWQVQLNLGTQLEVVDLPPGGPVEVARTWAGTGGPIRKTGTTSGNTKVDVIDWDGDGFLDWVDARQTSQTQWDIKFGRPADGTRVRPNLLVRAHNGLGGLTQIRYEPSTAFTNTAAGDPNPHLPLPFVVWVTTGLRRTDGLCTTTAADPFDPLQNSCIENPTTNVGHELIRTFSYQNGRYNTQKREFRGFEKVIETDVDDNTHEITFSQGATPEAPTRPDETRGKMLLEVRKAGSHMVQQDTFDWRIRVPTSANRTLVWLAEQKKESLAVPATSGVTQCLANRFEAPDDFGRTTTSCSLPCGTGTAGSCASPAASQVTTTIEWWPGSSTVRERPQKVKVFQGAAVDPLMWKLFDYDASGNNTRLENVLAGEGHADNPVLTREYDGWGNATKAKDPVQQDLGLSGQFTLSDFNGTGSNANPFELHAEEETLPQTNGVAHVIEREVDIRYGKPLWVDDENNQRTSFTYDSLGRPLTKTLPCDSQPGQPDSCIAGFPDRNFAYVYGSPGASSYLSKLSSIEVHEFEPVTGSYRIARAYFDALGRERLKTVFRMVGSATSPGRVVVEQTDFDRAGRPLRVYAPYEQSATVTEVPPSTVAYTSLDYNLNGQGPQDPLGRVRKVTPPDNRTTTMSYLGTLTKSADAGNNETRITRDALGRVIKKEALGQVGDPTLTYDYTYDGMGRLLTTEVSGNTNTRVTSVYDRLGREVERTDPNSGSGSTGLWNFEYDKNNNLRHANDPTANRSVQLCYDAINRPTKRLILAGNDYMPTGCATLPSGAAIESSYSYDQATSAFGFGVGRPTTVVDLSGQEVRKYDRRGRVVSLDKTVSSKTAEMDFAYDMADRIARVTYPDAEEVNYSYQADGQLDAVSSSVSTYVSWTEYDLFGRLRSLAHGNGTTDGVSYYDGTQAFRVDTITTTLPSVTHLNLKYFYDLSPSSPDPALYPHGKIVKIDDQRDSSGALSNDAVYTYDGLGRLKQVDWLPGTTYDETFAFDAIGNLTLKAGQPIVYGNPAKPHQATSHQGLSTMAYDPNGNRGDRVTPSEAQVYTYDALDRLTQVDLKPDLASPPSQTIAYLYDSGGMRVQKTVTTSTTQTFRYFHEFVESAGGYMTKYYYAGDRMIAARDVSFPALSEIQPGFSPIQEPWDLPPVPLAVFGVGALLLLIWPGRPRERRPAVLSATRGVGVIVVFVTAAWPTRAAACSPDPGPPPPASYRHYHLDHLGSTQVVTDSTGAISRQVRYQPYGTARRFSASGSATLGTENTRHEFTGYETQHETGLEYAGARFLDPTTGMFLSHDPAEQFASPYAYGPWDPTNTTDPSGAFVPELIGFAVTALYYASIAYSAYQIGNAVYLAARYGDTWDAIGVLGVAVATAYITRGTLTQILGPVAVPVNPVPAATHASLTRLTQDVATAAVVNVAPPEAVAGSLILAANAATEAADGEKARQQQHVEQFPESSWWHEVFGVPGLPDVSKQTAEELREEHERLEKQIDQDAYGEMSETINQVEALKTELDQYAWYDPRGWYKLNDRARGLQQRYWQLEKVLARNASIIDRQLAIRRELIQRGEPLRTP